MGSELWGFPTVQDMKGSLCRLNSCKIWQSKNQRITPLGCQDIRIWKFKFVAKTQFSLKSDHVNLHAPAANQVNRGVNYIDPCSLYTSVVGVPGGAVQSRTVKVVSVQIKMYMSWVRIIDTACYLYFSLSIVEGVYINIMKTTFMFK